MTTPEPAVSPAPDTEALRDLFHTAALRGIKDWDRDYDSRAAGPVTDYVLGVLHFVLGKRDKQVAGLRADLIEGAKENEELRAALRSTQRGLIRMERQRDALRVAICRAAGVDPDQISEVDTDYEAMCAELARVGARPIPDDAAGQFDALLDTAGSLLAHLVTGERGHPGEPCVRTHWVPEKRYAQYVTAVQAARDWRDRLSTPTTGPAPAAADLVREFHEAFGLPINDTTHTSNKLRAELIREEAREAAEAIEQGDALQRAKELADLAIVTYGAALTFGIDLDAAVRLVHDSNMSKLGDDGRPVMRADGKVLKGPGYCPLDMSAALSAAPQAPAEPTDNPACPACTTGRQHTLGDITDHHRDGMQVLADAVEAAREATAPPDDDCNDNLTAGFLRAPVGACSCQPTATVIHVPGTYCGDTQYEELLEAVEAGAEDQSAAVHLVLNRLANPTPEEKQ